MRRQPPHHVHAPSLGPHDPADALLASEGACGNVLAVSGSSAWELWKSLARQKKEVPEAHIGSPGGRALHVTAQVKAEAAAASNALMNNAASGATLRLTWSAAEDDLIIRSVEQMGQRWRKIAGMLPNRSDDAVRNRWHRLTSGVPPASALGGAPQRPEDGQAGAYRAGAYKCSRCGQPKKNHVCTAPPLSDERPEGKGAKGGRGGRAGEHTLGGEGDDKANGNEGRYGWTRREDDIILNAVLELGHKWVQVAARLPGRTEHATRNRYHRLTSREYAPAHMMPD